MIDKILDAVLNEAKLFLEQDGFGGQILLRTDFKPSHIPDYTMPLVLLALEDATDSFLYPGGLTQMGWHFGFNSYAYEADGYVDDESSYSTSLLRHPIDTIRQHFSLGMLGKIGWLNPDMYKVYKDYQFQFTLQNVSAADQLDQSGLVMGYKIGFGSTSLDFSTLFTENCVRLDIITQVDNPPFSPNEPIS